MTNRAKILIVIVFAVILLSGHIPKVSSSSTISQSYEDTVYMESSTTHEMLALFRYKAGLSIQTEPDGTWRGSARYEAIFSIVLDWYDSKLFPYGIRLDFTNLYLLGYAYFPSTINVTVYGSTGYQNANATVKDIYNYDYWKVRFEIGEASRFQGLTLSGAVQLRPQATYYVYNSTVRDRQLGYGQSFNAQNAIYITVKPEETEQLSESTFEDFSDTIEKTLNSFQLQVVVLDIGIIVLLLVTTIFIARKKPQTPTS